MFRVDDGELTMALKPMSCPCHVQIFNKGLRSWRELPIRYAEDGRVRLRERDGSQADVPLAEAASLLQARARPGALVAEAL
jgi:threonyl-tRNA synthetase